MAKTLGFGILGAGLIAPFHAKSVLNSRGGQLVAFCDMSKERVDKIAGEYNVKAYYALADMLQNRHPMSLTVRTEVSPQSQDWGYSLGSVYIRKVHFRDAGMIKQIEVKVVNRLRQVTAAIKQDGMNQVNIIASTAEQQAAIEFAKAAAMRPQIVGQALQKISEDRDISHALFKVLETQNIIDGEAAITLIPKNANLLGELVASAQLPKGAAAK